MTAVEGTDVDIPTGDGTADAYLTHPADGAPHPAVLLYMDGFGLRPSLRAMADRLAGAGYTVAVPNVLYREGRAPVVELPEFIDQASRPRIFERLGPMMRALTPDQVERDADAYLRWLAGRPEAAGGPVAVAGYCMGAALALRTAGAYPDRVAATAGFHGGNLATEAPDSPHLVAGRLTGEVYFAHADDDPGMPAEQQERLEAALTAAGVTHRCEVYPGAHHGYTQADTSAYDEKAAERHWDALLGLLKRTF
ncbi:dienelactone hydrolase family protein [Streptomyces coelicoflavus]|uniref:dienelactone hydrolase family protein n=1 Tax=Streptomyces TaxID=1883 RepID=UPI0002475AFD|nr:dienelactone hydrolase family protein [Streptomyces sp. CS159]EHN74590.1 hydrolase [Streptomyces coelicoflavus ZG0656]KPC75058.1 dienelactone hydrolase [Streptomyces sp. NRRL WC-3753]MZE46945.1 dienelactone hydrolase family protein [Streptomyces sp. SID5477]OWA01095.1 dienelactone hydrolase [Streptomyces sp. CS159]